MVNKNCLLVQFFLLVVASSIAFADPAIMVRKEIVRAAPDNQSGEVTVLEAGQKVELNDRQGGWYQVELDDGQSGWLPLLSIRKENAAGAPKKEKSSGLRGLLGSFRKGSSGVTVATGVRGLDAVDLKNSKPNMEELARIDQFVCSNDDARGYANQAGLVSRDVAWIQPPEKRR